MNILKFFTSPIFSDEEEKRKVAYFLKVILVVALISLPVLSAIKILSQSRLIMNDYILITFIILLGAYYLILIKFKKVFLVIMLFIPTSWIVMSSMAFVGAGVHDVTVIVFILIIFIAALLVGYKMALLMTILSITSVWIFTWADLSGIIKVNIDSPTSFSRDFSVIIIVVLTLIILYERSFQHSYKRVLKELHERRKAEDRLLQNELVLKEQNEEYLALNEELTESNARILSMNENFKAAKEKAEESDRLKTAFLQNISHEIRTPLNGIMGFAELLKTSEEDDEKRNEYIDIINASSQNLSALMDDLIDISRIEAGVIDLHISSFNLCDLLKELELFFDKSAKEKNLEISFSCNLKDGIIESDRSRIVQILNNLISNAIKFTEKGHVHVKVGQSGNRLEFSVIDSGIGIKEEDLAIIFDRFTQADMGLTRMYGGTGLGLSIAKGYVEYLGGKISVKSEFGKGSEFTFTIPVDFKSSEQNEPIVKRESRFIKDKIKILVAEDEDFNFFYIREMLKKQNCIITRAVNGLEAVELFKQNMDFDIILMDIKMPEMNGYDATRKIREINQVVPIIAVTAFAFSTDQQRSVDLRFDDYITKPITPNTLFDRINNILMKSEQ